MLLLLLGRMGRVGGRLGRSSTDKRVEVIASSAAADRQPDALGNAEGRKISFARCHGEHEKCAQWGASGVGDAPRRQ